MVTINKFRLTHYRTFTGWSLPLASVTSGGEVEKLLWSRSKQRDLARALKQWTRVYKRLTINFVYGFRRR